MVAWSEDVMCVLPYHSEWEAKITNLKYETGTLSDKTEIFEHSPDRISAQALTNNLAYLP
jgi:hypothetical protein